MQGLFDLGRLGNLGGPQANAGPPLDTKMNDTSEQIYISPLSLLKMLRHGKAGIPLEVMGLMLGDYVDDYTVKCIDVFSMPQSGTETTIESIDEGFQVKMVEMLKQTGRNEIVVGWYHSHPGFGCWLSSTDINTQKTFEQQVPRTVAVVVDPIQSVRGRVVIDAFRTYGDQGLDLGLAIGGGNEMRQTTSNLGEVKRKKGFSIKQLAKSTYYSILIEEMNKMSEKYVEWIEGEINKTSKEIYLSSVGKYNPRDHLESTVEELVTDNLNVTLTNMLNNLVF